MTATQLTSTPSSLSSFRLDGARVFVTGGSRGIGSSIVQTLATAGARVGFTYSSREDLAQAILEKLPGSGHRCYALNVSQEDQVESVVERFLSDFGGIDGLVNNAGITKDQLLLRMKAQDFDQVIQTNLRGTFLVCRGFLKSMVKARKGSVVNITSVIGQTGNAGQANYAASKAGTEAFTKSLALEVASRGIRANCIAPGFIGTEMTDILTEDQKKSILSQVPMGMIGQTEDVSNAVVFLLSEASKYITGHTLNVNGGLNRS